MKLTDEQNREMAMINDEYEEEKQASIPPGRQRSHTVTLSIVARRYGMSGKRLEWWRNRNLGSRKDGRR